MANLISKARESMRSKKVYKCKTKILIILFNFLIKFEIYLVTKLNYIAIVTFDILNNDLSKWRHLKD